MAVTIESLGDGAGWILASFDMSAAGTETLLADPGDGRAYEIKDFVVSLAAAGTFTLTIGSVNLTGVMNLASGTPLYLFQNSPVKLTASEALSIITATGAGKGAFRYRTL